MWSRFSSEVTFKKWKMRKYSLCIVAKALWRHQNSHGATDLKSFALMFAVCAHCDDAAEARRVWAQCPSFARRDPFVAAAMIDAMARSGALCDAFERIVEFEAANALRPELCDEI